tara:strand:- start:544 stop:1317 length:774 start_codon:yes stop_codon:yes gene_type:complete
MKFIPILFSTPMIQAIQENRKTQTRRAKGLKEINKTPDIWSRANKPMRSHNRLWDSSKEENPNPLSIDFGFNKENTRDVTFVKSKVKPGDIFWVRETWSLFGWSSMEGFVNIKYKDGTIGHYEPEVEGMDDWLERNIDKLLLKGLLKPDPTNEENLIFTNDQTLWNPSIFMPKWATRLFLEVTKVRVERLQDISGSDALLEGIILETGLTNLPAKVSNAKLKFQNLWSDINGIDSWNANPWVWVYDFKKIDKPSIFL